MIQDELIPHEEAINLKDLGFDEYCNSIHDYGYQIPRITTKAKSIFKNSKLNIGIPYVSKTCTAPTYHQVFKWFRDKYKFFGVVDKKEGIIFYKVQDKDEKLLACAAPPYKTYEEAELDCVKSLIEILKETKNDKDNN